MRHSLRPLSMLLTRGRCRIIRTAKNGRNGSDSDFTNATSRLEVAPGRIFATGDPLPGKPPAADHLALMGDVLLPAMEKAFDLSKKLFQGGAVHGEG